MREPPDTAPRLGAAIGTRLPRREDRALLTGNARHVGDLRLTGMLHAVLLRSPLPHAEITAIHTHAARAAPGVVAVLTAADLEGRAGPLADVAREELSPAIVRAAAITVAALPQPLLARDRVRWVGDPVAVVVATDPYLAEDARDLVDVDYEPLAVVPDARRGLEPDAPLLHPSLGSNIHTTLHVQAGDAAAALRSAEHRLTERFVVGRQAASAIESRGVLASWEAGQLTVWDTTTKPHLVRTYVARALDLPVDAVRFASPDMGGSFGGSVFPEEVLVPFLARHLGRPVRWLEDRAENLTATVHGRDQVHDVEVGFSGDGTITAIRTRFLIDAGAYHTAAVTVAYNTVAHLRGQYRIDHLDAAATVALSNRAPAAPVRGAGRPEAAFVMERVVDLVAARLGLDPLVVRARNLIRPEDMPYAMGMPYRDGVPMAYESGDFPAQLDTALEVFGYGAWRRRQAQARAEGRCLGIGVAGFVEGSGHGPFEGAIVRIDETGHVTVAGAARPHGQGHETMLAQVAADQLGIDPSNVTVRAGDTGLIPHGRGSYASRTAVVAGNAVAVAAAKVRQTILAVAGELLEVDPADLVLQDGRSTPSAPPTVLDLRPVGRERAGPPSPGDPGSEPACRSSTTSFLRQRRSARGPTSSRSRSIGRRAWCGSSTISPSTTAARSSTP